MFYPPPAVGAPTAPAGWRLEDVSIATRDGTALAGVLALPAVAEAAAGDLLRRQRGGGHVLCAPRRRDLWRARRASS